MIDPVPGTVTDLTGHLPLPAECSFEPQFQIGTQSNPSTNNPFAYPHGVQLRSWFHYDGLRDTTLSGGASYIDYFFVPGTSNYAHPEWRFTALGTLQQTLHGGSLYQQLRGEWLNFRDSHGVPQHLPRIRFRFGQNIHLGEEPDKPYLGIYEEAIVQFPQPSYSHVTFEGARFFAGYGFSWRSRTKILLGFKAIGEVSSSGSTVTLYYGPSFSFEYKFTDRAMNEKHIRTTAFRDSDF